MAVTAVGLPPSATSMSFGRFELENGQYIDDVVLGYTTYGELNAVRPSPPPALAQSDRARRAFSVFPPRAETRASRDSPILAPDHPPSRPRLAITPSSWATA